MNAANTPLVVWQRVPQGWIELVAFRDRRVAHAWWELYLSTGAKDIDEPTRAALTEGFWAGYALLKGGPFQLAGLLPYMGESPAVIFMGTTILPTNGAPNATEVLSSFTGLIRLGTDMATETFETLDGRLGSATLGNAELNTGETVGIIHGDVPLAVGVGHAFVLGFVLGSDHLDILAPYVALALDSTEALDPEQTPEPYVAESNIMNEQRSPKNGQR